MAFSRAIKAIYGYLTEKRQHGLPGEFFSDSISVSQKAKGDVIKIVFSGDVFCSLFFGSDNTYPSLGIYEERLDHIDKTFVEE